MTRAARSSRNRASSSNISIAIMPAERSSFPTYQAELAWQTRLRDRFYDLYVHLPMQKIIWATGCGRRTPGDPHGVEEARAQLRRSYSMIEQQMTRGGLGDGRSIQPRRLRRGAALVLRQHGGAVLCDEHGNRDAYFERLKSRPSFARVMKEAEPYFRMVPEKEN